MLSRDQLDRYDWSSQYVTGQSDFEFYLSVLMTRNFVNRPRNDMRLAEDILE